MTATITTLTNAIKEAIDTAVEDDTFSLDLNAYVADSQSAELPDTADPMDVQISYAASTTLARSSTRALDQFLVNVNLSYRHPDSSQANLAACHEVAEQLRDVLAAFHDSTSRVEQILTPSPFDQPQALQGCYQHAMTLDCDVLRSLHTATAPTVTESPRLGLIRAAVWDSIDNWAPFDEVWTRKFQTSVDTEELALHDPGLADLPAISVSWGNIGQNWWTHREQKWPASLNVVFWLPAHQIEVAEWRSQQLVECLFRSKPVGQDLTYLKFATGYPPEKYSQTIEPVELGRGQNKAIRGTIAFTLPASFQPY